MRIAIISDTHLQHLNSKLEVPECDLLIHCGDALCAGTEFELKYFSKWFEGLPGKHKIFVAGNHDEIFENDPALARSLLPKSVYYLQDNEITIDGIRIWGSPWQPAFCNWAFNLKRGDELRRVWKMIPTGIDILITHGPPLGILDWGGFSDENIGCADLRNELLRIKPKLHCFGHIHTQYGTEEQCGILFVNAAMCGEGGGRYTRDPIIVSFKDGKACLSM